jgi:hypothetical protein
MVREEDAPKVNRIVERFNLSIVDTAMLRTANNKKLDDNAKPIEEISNNVEGGAKQEEIVTYSNEEVMEELLGDSKEKLKNETTLSSKMEKEVPSKHS